MDLSGKACTHFRFNLPAVIYGTPEPRIHGQEPVNVPQASIFIVLSYEFVALEAVAYNKAAGRTILDRAFLS
jgi:hypothetical protein